MITSHERVDVATEEQRSTVAKNGERRVTELMSWALLTAPLTMPCKDVLALAATRAVHHVPVLDGGVMVGIVCSCDLRTAGGAEMLGRRMRSPVVTITANAAANEALTSMKRHDVGALPVLYHGFLIGIVTTGDLVRARVLPEQERPTCSSCGAHHHVRQTHPGGTQHCLACRERRAR